MKNQWRDMDMPPTGGESPEWIRQFAQKDFIVYLGDLSGLERINVPLNLEKAKSRTSPTSYDEEVEYKMIDYGETIIKGVTVYFKEYMNLEFNRIEAEYLFEINDRWYTIYWRDKLGNPNRNAINSKVAQIIKDAKRLNTII